MKFSIIFLIFLIFFPLSVFASTSVVALDMDSGRVLYQNNCNEKKLIASTTKIMTAIVTIENINLNKKIIVGNEILKMYGTSIYLEVGEKIRVKDLLYGLLLRSGNDAAVVLAKNVAGSEKKFVAMMNEKAKELGMKNTVFRNPHGLDEYTKNYSTAYDMALLSSYANNNQIYKKIVSTEKYECSTKNKTYLWYNRNKLLFNYEFNAFVIVELKLRELKKEDKAQIEFYMKLVDEQLKKPYHNKTIGIIISKESDNFIVNFVRQDDIVPLFYELEQLKEIVHEWTTILWRNRTFN